MSADPPDRRSPGKIPSSGRLTDGLTTSGGEVQPTPESNLTSWGELELLDLIGQGGFGRVYRAWDPTLARAVALKIIRVPEASAASSILLEGQLLAKLRHPHIVTVYGAQQRGNTVGLVMELVEGRSLADIVQRDGPLSPDEACVIGVNLCQALAAVHGAGLVHRDVKAKNVIRESRGRIVLMDFGAGLDLYESRPREIGSGPTGTPLSMAPEVLLGQAATPCSDIYSLGVLLFYLTTGRHPVEARTIQELIVAHGLGQRTPLVDIRPDVREGFVRVVDRALAAHPEDRFSSAGRMMRELLNVIPTDGATSLVTSARSVADAEGVATHSQGKAAASATGQPAAGYLPPAVNSGFLSWVWILSGIVLGLWIIGLVSSIAFNNTFGLPADFSNESPFDWLIWGVRSSIAPIVYMMVALIPFMLIAIVWRLLSHVSITFETWNRRVRAQGARFSEAFHLTDPSVLVQVMFAAEVLALGLLWWRFGDLLLASATYIADAEPSELVKLAPGNVEEHIRFGQVIDVLLLVIGIGWYGIFQHRRRTGARGGLGLIAAGLSMMVFLALAWGIPYRIIWHNAFERAAVGGERCYLIGERAEQWLVYCPDGPKPKNRLVLRSDPGVRRENVFESVFTPALIR